MLKQITATALTAALLATGSHAATLTWTGAANNNWSTTDVNWVDESSNPTAWVQGSVANFGLANTTYTVIGTIQVAGGTFTHNTSNHPKLTAGTGGNLEIGGDMTFASGSSGTIQFNLPVKLTADVTTTHTTNKIWSMEAGDGIDLNGYTLTTGRAWLQRPVTNGHWIMTATNGGSGQHRSGSGSNGLGSTMDVTIETGAYWDRTYTQTLDELFINGTGKTQGMQLTVNYLTIDGVGVASGNYTAASSGFESIITGSGFINVLNDPIPEPASLALMGLGGLLMLGGRTRRA